MSTDSSEKKIGRRDFLSTSAKSSLVVGTGIAASATALTSCDKPEGKTFVVRLYEKDGAIVCDENLKAPVGTKKVIFVLTTPGWALRFAGADDTYNASPTVWVTGDSQKTKIQQSSPANYFWFETTKIPKSGGLLKFYVVANKIKAIQDEGTDKPGIILAEGDIGGGGCVQC